MSERIDYSKVTHAIAQRIAEKHGGKIEVESALDQDSRIIVTLPCLS